MNNLEAHRDELLDLIENEGCSFWKALEDIHKEVDDIPLDVDEMISWLLEEYEEPLLSNTEKATINSLVRSLLNALNAGDDDILKSRVVVYKKCLDLCIGIVPFNYKPEDASYAAAVDLIDTYINIPTYLTKDKFTKLEDNKYYLLKEIL